MTKQERIKETYDYIGFNWEDIEIYVDKNGSIDLYECNDIFKDFIKFFGYIGHGKFRPLSLVGIDNNNGWIKITSNEDLPEEDCDCYIIDRKRGMVLGEWKQAPSQEEHEECCEYWIKHATY